MQGHPVAKKYLIRDWEIRTESTLRQYPVCKSTEEYIDERT